MREEHSGADHLQENRREQQTGRFYGQVAKHQSEEERAEAVACVEAKPEAPDRLLRRDDRSGGLHGRAKRAVAREELGTDIRENQVPCTQSADDHCADQDQIHRFVSLQQLARLTHIALTASSVTAGLRLA